MEKLFTFTKENGFKIQAKGFIPEGEGPFPTVVFSHGFGANYRMFEHHGRFLKEHGIFCMMFDFCGGGMESLSDGTMADMNLYTEFEDLRCVIKETLKLSYADENRFFLQGESMGGFVSTYIAAELKDLVKGLILWYPAFVIPDDSKKRFEAGEVTCLGVKTRDDFNETAMKIDIYEIMKKYEGPVVLIHGDEDKLVPISYSVRAMRTFSNAKLHILAGAEHGFGGADSKKAIRLSMDLIEDSYVFWGHENAYTDAVNDEYPGIYTPYDLYDALSLCWCAKTCAPRLREHWTAENKTLGQCSISAFLAQDIFGGKVYGIERPDGNFHCYNVIDDISFDLTSEQFGDEVLEYDGNPLQERESHFAKDEKRERYETLKKLLKEYCERGE